MKTRLQQPISFLNTDVVHGGDFTLSVPGIPPPDTPQEFLYDWPPEVRVLGAAVYPVELLRAGTTGSATVSMTINAKGFVDAVEVVNASAPEFGKAAAAAA